MEDDFTVHENKGTDFERVPCGAQPALASKLYNLGFQPGYQGKKPVKQIVVLFELQARRQKGDYAGQRFQITQCYNASLGSDEKPSKLRDHLTSWRGRQFTAQETAAFDLRAILGKLCTLSLVEATKTDGKKIAKVMGIMPRMNGTEEMKTEMPVDFIPEWVAKKQAAQLHPGEDAAADSPLAGTDKTEDDIPF